MEPPTMTRLDDEIARRRTFAIISHPDAGKTTMTEKLLLLGGAIQMAGTVKARKAGKFATSDWMKLEQERGISVTTSVMKFEFEGWEVNLLDTPGHNDFSEDTYRVLTAVDSALMLIDSAKGVETQTIKLMNVCRMRNTPIVTFMNKLDREGLDPFELIDNVEKVLDIDCCPMTWPIGMGSSFKGVYDIRNQQIQLYDASAQSGVGEYVSVSLDDPRLDHVVGRTAAATLREELELVTGAGVEFDPEAFAAGRQTPVFFGSALAGFGVEEMFRTFAEVTPAPQPREALERMVSPHETAFTGFVFKIQANMDPKHRDRIAFMRVCSGRFERGGKAKNVRLGREMKFANPIIFMAQSREIVEEAWPGDIVGLHDTGTIEIGDTFSDSEELHFTGIPAFAPEIFRRVRLEDPLGMKKLQKGLRQLSQEGAVQLFVPVNSADLVVGVVGALQLDVLKHRLEAEYGVRGIFEHVELATARWYNAETEAAREAFERAVSRYVARDVKDRPVYLVESLWRLNYTAEQHPKVRFFETSDGYERS
jgi:peptide chain release factor 3